MDFKTKNFTAAWIQCWTEFPKSLLHFLCIFFLESHMQKGHQKHNVTISNTWRQICNFILPLKTNISPEDSPRLKLVETNSAFSLVQPLFLRTIYIYIYIYIKKNANGQCLIPFRKIWPCKLSLQRERNFNNQLLKRCLPSVKLKYSSRVTASVQSQPLLALRSTF